MNSIVLLTLSLSVAYLLIGIMHKKYDAIFSVVLLIYIIICCSIGFYQVIKYLKNDNSPFIITGPFDNPGIFGGFISVVICILIPSYKTLFKSKYIHLIYELSIFTSIIFLSFSTSRTAVMSLIISMLVYNCRKQEIKVKFKKYFPFLFLFSLTIVICAYYWKKPSADGRFFINRISFRIIKNNFSHGVGLGNFAGAFGQEQSIFFKEQLSEIGRNFGFSVKKLKKYINVAGCPDNAFNEYLNIGVEYGVPIMIIFIMIIITGIYNSYKKNNHWCYGLISSSIFSLFSYPLHIWQFQVLLPVIIISCFRDSKPLCFAPPFLRITFLLFILSFFSFIIPSNMQYCKANKIWKDKQKWYEYEYYDYVVEDYELLFPYLKRNKQFLFEYGRSLNKTENYEKSDSILSLGTLISSDPMFWNVMGNNSLALGKYREAEERYMHAFYMVPNRLYPLTLLAKLYHTEKDTVRFLEMAEIVETFVPKIESYNTELLRSEIKEIKDGYIMEKDVY